MENNYWLAFNQDPADVTQQIEEFKCLNSIDMSELYSMNHAEH